MKIKGGYYIKARKIQESDIAFAPPHVREIWDWLLKEANHADNGKIKRGQTVRTYKDIQEGLHWMVGYRKETYKKWQCEIAMKYLTKQQMITTTKTTRGLIITICNYDIYQNPKNYESHNESHKKATRKPQPTDTINKKNKNDNNENYKRLFEKIKSDIEFPEGFEPVIVEWLKYKSEKGQSYKETGIRTLIRKLIKEYKNSNELKQAIENSISNNYQGIYKPKNNGNDTKPKRDPRRYPNDLWDQEN